jgi:hypothetical protein
VVRQNIIGFGFVWLGNPLRTTNLDEIGGDNPLFGTVICPMRRGD